MSTSKTLFKADSFRYREWYQGCKGKIEEDGHRSVESQLQGLEATGQWVAEPKRDGIWCANFIDPVGCEFYSRTQERKPYPLDSVSIPQLAGTLFGGELGFGSQESIRRRAELGHDFVDVYEVIYWQYKFVGDLNGEDRRDLLVDIFKQKWMPTQWLLTPRWDGDFVGRYRAEPEGLILKPKFGFPYVGGGQKVKQWVKVKKDHTVDMVVMGYEESTAETKAGKGMIEHLVCGMYVPTADGVELKELTKTGGMTHEMQQEIVALWPAHKGRVVELKHFGQFKSGALRHPSVVRFRDDKKAEQCIFDPEQVNAKSFRSL